MQTFTFPLSLGTLHSDGYHTHLQTLYITNASSEEEPRHFLIYHYITAHVQQILHKHCLPLILSACLLCIHTSLYTL